MFMSGDKNPSHSFGIIDQMGRGSIPGPGLQKCKIVDSKGSTTINNGLKRIGKLSSKPGYKGPFALNLVQSDGTHKSETLDVYPEASVEDPSKESDD